MIMRPQGEGRVGEERMGEEASRPQAHTPRRPYVLWGVLAVGAAAGVLLILVLTRPREQASTIGPQPLPGAPSAAIRDDFLAQIHAGIAAYHAKHSAEAIQAFEAASKLQPSEPLPYRYLAELYWREGRHEQARQAVRSVAVAMPDAYALDQVGTAYGEAGLSGLAIQFYLEAVRLDPQFPGARYNLGRTYLEAGDLEPGIAEVQEALRLHPDFPEAHQALGLAYTEQGRLAEALMHLQRALMLHPDLMVVRNHLGRLYMMQGRLDEAIQTFRFLVERAPNVVEARHNLAVAYARTGLQELAIDQFKEVLRRRPDFHAARLDLATLLLEMRRPQAAIAILQEAPTATFQSEAQSNQRDLIEVRYRLGIAYRMAGQPGEAIQELEAVLQMQPAHVGAHANLGHLYYQTHQFDRAWRHARWAESLGLPMADLLAALRRVSVEPP